VSKRIQDIFLNEKFNRPAVRDDRRWYTWGGWSEFPDDEWDIVKQLDTAEGERSTSEDNERADNLIWAVKEMYFERQGLALEGVGAIAYPTMAGMNTCSSQRQEVAE
jgi:hypothetical protein